MNILGRTEDRTTPVLRSCLDDFLAALLKPLTLSMPLRLLSALALLVLPLLQSCSTGPEIASQWSTIESSIPEDKASSEATGGIPMSWLK